MKAPRIIFFSIISVFMAASGCINEGKMKQEDYLQGTYGYDKYFFKQHNIGYIELGDSVSGAYVLVVPEYQGRVMTSTSGGYKGRSFGWINHDLISSGIRNNQFNPFGGEERFWLGPEGGPFSIYFGKGEEQTFENWKVPPELDTEPFKVISKTPSSAAFNQEFRLQNASGTELEVGVERIIRLLDRNTIAVLLDTDISESLDVVSYETENTIINKGGNEWNTETGFLSVWLLGMFNPSENGVVFIPIKPVNQKVVTDDYFGKVPPDRLFMKDSMLFFKVDGKFRSKIGISPGGVKNLCGSYDPDSKTLTVLWFSLPEEEMPYVNSKWGNQDPLTGDAVNSYNDGPVEDGSIMGPFFEIESSSPAALLKPGEKISHIQRICHITGEESELDIITGKLFGVRLEVIKTSFAE